MEYSVILKGILTGNYDEGELWGKNLDELNQLCAGMRELMTFQFGSNISRI